MAYVLSAIRNNSLEYATKEETLKQYLSMFTTEQTNQKHRFSNYKQPVPRSVVQQPSQRIGRLKSAEEMRSRKSKKPSSNAHFLSQDSYVSVMSQESSFSVPSTVPVEGKKRSQRSCIFCKSKEHASWDKCKVEGKASKLNATVVQESQLGYRCFINGLAQMNHFVEEAVTEEIDLIHEKIPRRCIHIVVNKIIQVPVSSGLPTSNPSYISFKRVVQLQLLGQGAVEMDEYTNQHFHLQGVIDWITEFGNKLKITRRVFHRLKRFRG